ncbi:MAG: hypothetical protein FWC73_00800 [Defluviitaleaceae bacterium]|nr:hypothetical protein [Defluviitaleaceae bacterium]
MSIFGFVSLFIVVLSVAIIVLHYRVMKRRAPVDTYFTELENLLRQRIELLYAINPVELSDLYDQSITIELSSLLAAIAEIDVEHKSLEENSAAIDETRESLSKAIGDYNTFIAAKPHTILMAKILGLAVIEDETTEEE